MGSDEGIIYRGEESSVSVHWSRFLTAGCTMQLRIKEHRRALTNSDRCMSALGEHAMNHHDIAWEDATVVDADPICTVAEHLMHGTSVSSMVHCHVFSFFLPARPFCFYISYQLYLS